MRFITFMIQDFTSRESAGVGPVTHGATQTPKAVATFCKLGEGTTLRQVG